MKTAIIIGATSGIGRELARRLVAEGWRVGAAGRREERLAQLQEECGAESVEYEVMDITKPEALEALDRLLEKTGAPDLFLHVSGVGRQNRQLDESIDVAVMETNGTGLARMLPHILNYVKANPYYTSQNKAHIAVVTSVAGTMGLGVSAAYSASKKMQSTYVSALCQLCHMEKIPAQFSDIRPGFVATDILDPQHHYPMMMTVEEAAGHILKGLKRKRRVIVFDWRYKLMVAFWRLTPRWLWERMNIHSN
jgi:short-subunit dehydrogenase